MKKFNILGVALLQFAFLVFYVLLILFFGVRRNWTFGLVLGLLPVLTLFVIKLSTHPYWIFVTIFIVNYYIMGLTRYIQSLKGGITIDILFGVALFALIINGISKNVPIYWKRANNPTTYIFLIWLLYCFFELFNTESIGTNAWLNGIRPMAWYGFVIVLITQLLCKNYKQLRTILLILSVLVLTALLKMYLQHSRGFDSYEWRWLIQSDGIRTHIVNGMIRYFSFFTDAANFGCNMAFMFLIFLFAGLGEKKKWIKYYYLIIAIFSIIGMGYSGTRAAVVIPFAGIACFILLSKSWSKVIIFSIIFALAFCFFKYTTIGEGNSLIRRTRTAFSPKKENSFLVRMENQKKLKKYMTGKYFGAGIGSIGGNSATYAPNAYLTKIPPDSWLVMVWVDDGIFGLVLYLGLFGLVFIYEGWIILFKLKDKGLRYTMIGMYGGVVGMLAASYANEIFSQFPNGFLIHMCIGFIAISPYFDKEIEEERIKEEKEKSAQLTEKKFVQNTNKNTIAQVES